MTTETKSTLNRDLILAARQGLLPVRDSGWLGGFGNLFSKELGEWFGTRRWLVQSLIWLLIINGMMAFIMFIVPLIDGSEAFPPEEMLTQAWGLYFGFASIFGIIGMIITAQDEVIHEKQSGTAAWVLSKPIARPAFILTKLLSNVIGALVIIVGLTALVAYGEIFLFTKEAIPVLPFIASLGVLMTGLVFYLALTIMLGTLFEQRGPVLGIATGVFLGGMIFAQFLPQVSFVLPVNINNIAPLVAFQQPLPDMAIAQLTSAGVLSLAFTVMAIWRFGREEF
jgi:ABC-2 type transport system permease protein